MEFSQLLLSELQSRFAGVDAKLLQALALKLAGDPANGALKSAEEAKSLAEKITVSQLLDLQAENHTAAVTAAADKAIADYEKKHSLKDGKPTDKGSETLSEKKTQNPGPAGSEEIPAWARQLIDDNKTYRQELTEIKAARLKEDRLSRFRKAIEKAPEKVRVRYEKDFSRLSFKDDADFDSYLEEIAPDISAIAEQVSKPGPHVSAPFGSQGGGDAPSALVKARFEGAAKNAVSPAIAGLPAQN